ncbi:MAG: alpha-amylase family glycosyl hydrolase [Leptothrix sp. (in: b-proteobacteria)]
MTAAERLRARRPVRRLVALALAALLGLAACGGGGGGSDIPLTNPDVSTVAAADPGSALPASWRAGPFMEIYVRGYQDSDGDGIGDLRGLISRLDYLKDLGVTGLWLMPVTQSQDRDHGYAVSDYRAIERDYGSLADFDELLKQAHARGIGVIIDYVMNHSGAQHPLFQHARSGAGDPWRDWYLWQAAPPSGWSIYGGNPWRGTGNGSYYAPFWDQMPDFNLKNAAVVNWHHDNLRFWLNRGVDGFRFDAVGNLVENGLDAWLNQPQNYTLMHDVQTLVQGYAQRYMVCEAPDDPKGFAALSGCGAAFAFGQQYDLVAAARGDAAAVARVAAYYASAPAGLAGFASNHDSFAGQRLWDQLGGNAARLRLAAATYLLQSGTPFLYYGEEIGMAGGAGLSGDWALRTPMSWSADTRRAGFTTGQPFRNLSANVATQNVAAQQADAGSLLNFYRQLIALRKVLPALQGGSYAAAAASGAALQFRRVLGSETVWVGINYGSAPATLSVSGLAANTTLQRHWPTGQGDLQADARGAASVTLPAQSFAVLRVGP